MREYGTIRGRQLLHLLCAATLLPQCLGEGVVGAQQLKDAGVLCARARACAWPMAACPCEGPQVLQGLWQGPCSQAPHAE